MTLATLVRLVESLKRHEGAVRRGGRHVAYRDPVGKLTIGWGRNLDDVGLSDDEAEMLLLHDVERTAAAVRAALPWAAQLDEVRRAVLIELAFNMGLGGLLTFERMLEALQRGDWDTAAQELLDSRYARQVGARARRLAERLRTGSWDS